MKERSRVTRKNSRRERRDRISQESDGSLAIFIVSLFSIVGTAYGIDTLLDISPFSSSLLWCAALSAVIYAVKRFCISNIPFYELTTESVLFKGSIYLLMAVISGSMTAYGLYVLTTPKVTIPETKLKFAEPVTPETRLRSEVTVRGWVAAAKEIRSRIWEIEKDVRLSGEKGEKAALVNELVHGLKQLLMNLESQLFKITFEINAQTVQETSAGPVAADEGMESDSGGRDWRKAVREIKSFLDEAEKIARLAGEADSARTALSERIYDSKSDLRELEAGLNRFPDQANEPENKVEIAPTNLAPTENSNESGSLKAHSDYSKWIVPPVTTAPGLAEQVTLPNPGIMEFIGVASRGDWKAVSCLTLALLLELMIFHFVKRKQHRETMDW
jgi:hypothetical protein